ncbi:hypothetical protein U9M48_016194 [Paspalum notatum var. saurae]|uniref:Pentatricopeptide repeat-containing protein n=1 Tax=Paspalum notatum var. saurae TaxID=547442 RepID=A0AAQ3T6I9_PASNO
MALQQPQAELLRLVDALCSSGRSAEAHRRASLLLLSAASRLDGRAANVLLRRLLRARTPFPTLRLLQHAAAQLAPSLPNYNRLLALLCRHEAGPPHLSVLLAHRLLLRMRVPPNALSYAALLDGYARVPDPGAARKLLDEMRERGLAPSSLARTFLVKAFLRARDVDAAMDLVDNSLWPCQQLGEEDQEVTNAAFANLVQCLCAEGFFHVVFRIAEEMPQRRRGVSDEFAYAQMIDSLCRAGQHHGASRIVYIMRKRGVCPSAVSYNCIVHGLCTSPKPGACLRAHQLVMEGTCFGYRPREATYKVLVDELCRKNELAKAKDVLGVMLQPTIQCGEDDGGGADSETRTRIYNVFLGALRGVENPNEQLGVLVSMLQAGCKPDVITMNTVIHGFCKSGRAQEARRIMDDMLNGKFCAPDVVTFTTLISGYLDAGHHAEALDVLHSLMPRRRCSPTVVTYNCVLKGLFGIGQVDAAMQLLDEMSANKIAADSMTHTVVIKGLCDAGQLEKAKEFWDNVIWPSGIHDDYVYSAIFRGLCEQKKLEQACDFMYELVDCGVAPSAVCYNILINAACKQGLKKLAYQLVKEMKRNGLAPDAVTWRILGKLHHYEEEEQEEHQLSPADVGRSSANERVEPLVSTKEMPLIQPLSPSKNIYEINENNNTAEMEEEVGYLTDMANDNQAETKEVGYSTKMPLDEPPDNTDTARGTTVDKSDITSGDNVKKPDNQCLIREPLSKVAKRVQYFSGRLMDARFDKMKGPSEVTVTLVLSRETVTESPRLPALPPATLMRSCRNFSSEAISMILSSTGLVQSIVKAIDPFFLPPAAPPFAAATPRAISLTSAGARAGRVVWRLGFSETREGGGCGCLKTALSIFPHEGSVSRKIIQEDFGLKGNVKESSSPFCLYINRCNSPPLTPPLPELARPDPPQRSVRRRPRRRASPGLCRAPVAALRRTPGTAPPSPRLRLRPAGAHLLRLGPVAAPPLPPPAPPAHAASASGPAGVRGGETGYRITSPRLLKYTYPCFECKPGNKLALCAKVLLLQIIVIVTGRAQAKKIPR